MTQSPFSQETAKIIDECRAARERAWSEIAETEAATRKIIIESWESIAEVNALMARRMLPPASARMSDRQSPLLMLIWWDIYPPPPCGIRLGEVEAADEREATEKAAKIFGQDPAKLTALRQFR
jgi:hypothetical protein